MIRSGKPDSAFDSSKQFYRGNKYTPTDYGRESYGRPKGKTVTGNSPSKQVWEPMEPKKYPRSNSDSDITLRSSSTVRIEEMEPENSGSSSKISHEGNVISASSMEILVGAEIVNGEAGLCPVGSNSSNVATTSSASNSDNCSSCLSEGDSNTASSSHGNTESSSTSDSEDASQQSEGREMVCSIPSSFSEHLEKTQNLESPPAKSEKNERVATVIPQPQGLNSPMCRNNQNLHFPVFQAPPAMGGGYYHQSPVSWPAAPANGLMQFPHPNHYLYAAPVGYGLNGDSPFCLQYGAVPPLFNPGHVPVYQPPPPKPKNCDEQPYTERPVPVPAASPLQCGYNPSPSPAPSHEDSGFSLFHFGGPVAFSAGHKQEPAPDLPGDHKSSTTGETVVEEYNLFTSSNVIWSSIFGDSIGKV